MNGAINVTNATSVTSSEVWTMGTRGNRDRDHYVALDRNGRSPAPRADRTRTRQIPNGETDVGMAPQGPKKA